MWYVIAGIAVLLIVIFIVKKVQEKKSDINPLEKYLNTEAIVTEQISDTLGKGKVKLGDTDVQAYRGKPGVIDAGKKVKIIEIGLHKVKVEPVESAQPAVTVEAEK
jgi:membrane protein implicated in regulation of membrane protease activity